MLAVSASVIAPSLQSSAIDHIVNGYFGDIPRILGLMLLAYLIHGSATLLQGFFSARLSQRVIFRLWNELFNKVVSLPIPYLDNHSHGDIMNETKTTPLAKQSKKNRKNYHGSQRGSWLGINPATRMPANPKAYNRAKKKTGSALGSLRMSRSGGRESLKW